MEPKDIADLFITTIDKIEFYWNFYTATVLALIGWLISTRSALAPRLQFLITISYLVFVSMNIVGLLVSYTVAESLRLDLLTSLESEQASLEHTRAVLSAKPFDLQRNLVLPIHLLVGVFVLYAVWFGRGSNNTTRDE